MLCIFYGGPYDGFAMRTKSPGLRDVARMPVCVAVLEAITGNVADDDVFELSKTAIYRYEGHGRYQFVWERPMEEHEKAESARWCCRVIELCKKRV